MSERADDNHDDLIKRLDRVATSLQSIEQAEPCGAQLLTLLEAEGVRVKVKKRKKDRKRSDR
jgi:hypothetical protein